MADRKPPVRLALALAAVALTLLVAPLALNIVRGGAEGVGYDPRTQGSDLRFAVSYAETASEGPVSGTLYVIVSRMASPEPRLQVGLGDEEPWVIRRRVVSWTPGRGIEVTDEDAGLNLPSLAHIPPGYWFVQAVLDVEGPGGGSGSASGAGGSAVDAGAVGSDVDAAPGGPTVDTPAGVASVDAAAVGPTVDAAAGVASIDAAASGASIDAAASGAAAPPGWAVRPGNLVSRPVELYVDPRSDDILRVYLARRIAGEGR